MNTNSNHKFINQNRIYVCVGLSILATLIGCSDAKAPWEQTQPVVGSITYKGKPISDAEIAFFPEDTKFPESVRPRAKSKPDGTFEPWTYETGDGVPPGSYKVTVVHHEIAISKDTIVAKPNDLPPKYSKLDSTDLRVEVKAGDNQLPAIDLK